MTDRLRGVFVVFERDVREDDAEHVISAIRQLRGVIAVEPSVTNPSDVTAEIRARQDVVSRLLALIDDFRSRP